MVEKPIIIVADDDESNRQSMERILRKEGYEVLCVKDGNEALEKVRRHEASVLLTDLKMPGMSGLELLVASRAVAPELEVIVMTAYGTVEAAVEAMKEGAYDFISKPLKRIEIVKAVKNALEKSVLSSENRHLKARLEAQGPKGIIGSSPPMRAVMELLTQIAPSSANVLIEGASGTGKELVAQAIHELSPRRDKRFVKVNLAALPEALVESELFGYEPGAFTGAVGRREGRFELAHGGALFLDEVGELSPSLQVKLLRVLQEGEFERLGGNKTVTVDVRIVAATNKVLEDEVAARRFREDLYYRLNVISIRLPSLKERPDDIPLLLEHFLAIFARKNQRNVSGWTHEALELLMSYPWPGNVRELENTVERAVVLARGELIGVEELPQPIRRTRPLVTRDYVFPFGTPLREVKSQMIRDTLKHTGGDKALAARLLGINPRTILRQLEDWAEEEGSEQG